MKKAVVSPGAEVLLSGAPLPKSIAAKAARVGLITNPTGVLPNLRPHFVVLAELYTLAALFSPGTRRAGRRGCRRGCAGLYR